MIKRCGKGQDEGEKTEREGQTGYNHPNRRGNTRQGQTQRRREKTGSDRERRSQGDKEKAKPRTRRNDTRGCTATGSRETDGRKMRNTEAWEVATTSDGWPVSSGVM